MKITWEISSTEFEKLTGAILKAHWLVNVEDSVGDEQRYSAQSSGIATFMVDTESPNFIPYDQITKSNVLNWVWEEINKDEVEAHLAAQIEAQKNPTTATGTPW